MLKEETKQSVGCLVNLIDTILNLSDAIFERIVVFEGRNKEKCRVSLGIMVVLHGNG